MSDIVEKAFFSLQSLVTSASGRSIEPSRPKGFQNLIDVVAGSTNKREQDTAIQRELSLLKSRLSQPCLKPIHVKDSLIRAIYCEMLGYPAPFVYIHAIKQAEQGSLADKRIGYLAATLFLQDDHELVILIVNTIQKDLRSTNILEINMALTATTYLVNPEMISTILDLVEEKLIHQREMVRKKTISTLHRFLLISPTSVTHVIPRVKTCIGDRDPEVVLAAVHFFTSLAKIDVASCKDLVAPLVEILDQVLQRKLSADFEYHGLPGPFVQIDILRLLALLGENDEHSSALMCEVLIKTLQKVDVNHSIGYALIYECVRTAASIWPSETLLDVVCPVIGRFLQSQNNNIKYMGLKALTCIVQKVGKKLASQHQSIIMECLHHPDVTIRTKILDVLFCLANPGNFQVVCSKIVGYLSATSSDYAKTKIVVKLLNLMETFSPDPMWHFEMLDMVMMKSSEESLPKVIQAVRELLTKACDDPRTSTSIQSNAVKHYLNLIANRTDVSIDRKITELAIWVLREYHDRCPEVSSDAVFLALTSQLERHIRDPHLGVTALVALKGIVIGSACDTVKLGAVLRRCRSESKDVGVLQEVHELSAILENLDTVRRLFADYEVGGENCDWTLGFLDQWVVEALSDGAPPYVPLGMRNRSSMPVIVGKTGPSSVPYDVMSTISVSSSKKDAMSASSISASHELFSLHTQLSAKLNLNEVKRVWSKEGYLNWEEPKTEKLVASPLDGNGSLDQNLNKNVDLILSTEDDELAKVLFDDAGFLNETPTDPSSQVRLSSPSS